MADEGEARRQAKAVVLVRRLSRQCCSIHRGLCLCGWVGFGAVGKCSVVLAAAKRMRRRCRWRATAARRIQTPCSPSPVSPPHLPVQVIAVLELRVKVPGGVLSRKAGLSQGVVRSPFCSSLNFSGPLNHALISPPYTHSCTGHDHAADHDDDKKKGQQQPTGWGVGGGGGRSSLGRMASTRGSGMYAMTTAQSPPS